MPGTTPDEMACNYYTYHSKDKSTYFFNEIPTNALTIPFAMVFNRRPCGKIESGNQLDSSSGKGFI